VILCISYINVIPYGDYGAHVAKSIRFGALWARLHSFRIRVKQLSRLQIKTSPSSEKDPIFYLHIWS
jgi:hypothetical protein